jgi:hypothetical protein
MIVVWMEHESDTHIMSFLFNLFTKAVTTGAGAATGAAITRMQQNAAYNAPRKVLRDGANLMYANVNVDPSTRVLGEPGASLYFAEELSESARNAGIKGEQSVAKILEEIAQTLPNTYVFHSVKLPGWEADMDHLLIRGSQAIIIDSKNWKHDATYELNYNPDGKDVVYRDGETFPGGEIGLKTHLSAWSEYLQHFQVSAILTVANDEAFTISLDDPGYQFVNLSGLKNAVFNVLPDVDAGELPYPTLRSFSLLVQNPNFNPADESNYVWVNDYSQQQTTYHTPPAYARTTTQASTSGLAIGITIWSILNYIVGVLLFPIIGFSAVALIIVGHKHAQTIKKEKLGGGALVTTSLIFSYLLFFAWVFFIVLVLIPGIFGVNR